MTRQLITADICARTGASRSTAARWVTRGIRLPDGRVLRLEADRIGGRWRYSPEHLAEFLAALNAAHVPQEPAEAGATA